MNLKLPSADRLRARRDACWRWARGWLGGLHWSDRAGLGRSRAGGFLGRAGDGITAAAASPGPEPRAESGLEELPGAGTRAFWTGLVVVVLSLISGFATYFILTGLTPIAPRNSVVVNVLFVNVVLIVAMCALLGYQAVGLWRAWQRKVAGARIHVRIVGLFTIIAAAPALLLALAATTTFSRSIDNWFSTRTRTIVANSVTVARAYLDEHAQGIRSDVINMARDLDDLGGLIRGGVRDNPDVRNLIMAQTGLRELSVGALIDADGKVMAEAANDTRVLYQAPGAAAIRQAEAGQVPVLMPVDSFRVAAVSKLARFPGYYLYAARSVNESVVRHLIQTEASVTEYERLRAARGPLKLVHGVMYFMIALTSVLAAIWVGLSFARHLVAPIRRLIGAAQRVARGDLSVELPLLRGEGDLRRLSRDFNFMTTELARQRNDLVSANDQLTERRQFMEAVLSGVSAGVIGLDPEGRVRLANPSAERLLGVSSGNLVGRSLTEVVPELARVAAADQTLANRAKAQAQIKLVVGDEERSFDVRVTREQGQSEGSVVTFDDITELVSAQRTSAWGDVARRIAHEIKNPLTPIQLSAERLRRKYAGAITQDRDTFEKLTDTIVRQVGDIKTMVDEFASFARIPQPEIENADIRAAVQEPMILFRESHPAVAYEMRLPQVPLIVACDRRLITQALTNLVKNATESVQAVADHRDCSKDFQGRVTATLKQIDQQIIIEVQDNGLGLPKQNRARLLEPYVTTKGNKGTGLGLAIVQKITEQHGGRLALEDAPTGSDGRRGALVRIVIPVRASRPVGPPTHDAGADRPKAEQLTA